MLASFARWTSAVTTHKPPGITRLRRQAIGRPPPSFSDLLPWTDYLADEGGENWYGKIDENYNNYLRGHLVVATVYSDKHIEKYLAAADSDCWSYETYFPAQEPSEPTPPGMPF